MESILSQEFHSAKKEGSGFMSRVADSFHNMSAAYMMKNRPPEFTVMNDYITMFSEKLGVLDRISQRISKEECGKILLFILLSRKREVGVPHGVVVSMCQSPTLYVE